MKTGVKATVKIDKALLERAEAAAVKAGYSSREEFIQHAIEKALADYEQSETADEEVLRRLKGLGYIE